MPCPPSRARMTKPPPGYSSGGGFAVLGGSVLEGVLDLLAGLLDIGLGLVALAFGLESLVAGGLTRGLLGVAAQLLSGVLDLVVESHDVPFRGPFSSSTLPPLRRRVYPRGATSHDMLRGRSRARLAGSARDRDRFRLRHDEEAVRPVRPVHQGFQPHAVQRRDLDLVVAEAEGQPVVDPD